MRRFLLALSAFLLSGLAFASPAYHRPRWGHPEHTCRDTRALVLAKQCRSVTWDARGCHVSAAVCLDIYSGAEVATDTAPTALQVDHLFSAHRAFEARAWAPREFERFFNDRDNLIVTRSKTNDRKGDKGPDGWCPALPDARRLVAVRYRRTATRWRLPISPAEEVGLKAWERGLCSSGARVL